MEPTPQATQTPLMPATTAEAEPVGIACGGCGCRHHWTLYTRAAPDGRIIRRRECRHCGRRFTTVEQARDEGLGIGDGGDEAAGR